MAVFTIEAPDGRKIKVEADDEETAIAGAEQWYAENSAKPEPTVATPPAGLKPGSKEYANWAVETVRAGGKLPQVGPTPPEQRERNWFEKLISPQISPEARERLDSAIQSARESGMFDSMSNEDFKRFADATMQPYGLMDQVKSGTLLGFTDELAAAQGAAGAQLKKWFGNPEGKDFGDAFRILQALEQARVDAGREQNGVLGTGAEVIGSLGSMGMSRGPGIFGPGATVTAAPRVAPATVANRGAETVAGNVVRNAALTAIPSGIAGFGNSKGDFGERVKDAGISAGAGALLGGGLTLAGRGASALLNRRAPSGLDIPADDMLTRAMIADGTLLPDGTLSAAGRARLAGGGADAMIADAGPNAAKLLDVSIQRSGRGGTIARDAIEQRLTRANAAAQAAMDQTLGAPQGVFTTEQGLRAGARPVNDAVYRAAYSQPIDYASAQGQQIEQLLQAVPGEAIRRANRLMQINRDPASRQILAEIADNGAVTFREMPDVRQIDYITRALNSEAKEGIGMGAMGAQTDIGRALQNLSRDLRNTLGDAVPEYRTALQTAAQPIAQREALQFGNDLLSPSIPRDVAADTVSGMTGPELAAVRQGLRSAVDEAVANVKRIASDPNVDARELRKVIDQMTSSAAREKIGMIMEPDAAQTLLGTLDEAMRALELRANVARNSQTFARTSLDEMVNDQVEGGAVGALLDAKPVNFVQRGTQAVFGRTPANKLARKDEIYAQIAEFLTTPRGQDALRRVGTIGQRAARAIPGLPANIQPILDALLQNQGATP